MNREIKFRKWHKELQDMTYSEGVFIAFFMVYEKYPDMYVLMQYTGLKDKNGKEIYEGDIVRKDSFSIGYCLPIVWWNAMFKVGESGISPLYDAEGYEVIGNIYQHPELLK